MNVMPLIIKKIVLVKPGKARKNFSNCCELRIFLLMTFFGNNVDLIWWFIVCFRSLVWPIRQGCTT